MSQLFLASSSKLAWWPTIPGVTTGRMTCISLLAVVIIGKPGWRVRDGAICSSLCSKQVRQRYGFVVVGYVVMPEHIHLLISEPEKGDPSRVMQAIKQGFSRRVLKAVRKRRVATQRELFALGAGARVAAALL